MREEVLPRSLPLCLEAADMNDACVGGLRLFSGGGIPKLDRY